MMTTRYCHRCDKLCNLGPKWAKVCETDKDEKECPRMISGIFAPDPQADQKSDQEFKADAGKPDPTLLEKGCPKAIAIVQSTLDYGALKYEAHSWKHVPDGIARYDAAARRHRNLRDQGETHDVESWLPHLAHEIINNLFLLELMIKADPGCQWNTFNPNPPKDHKK